MSIGYGTQPGLSGGGDAVWTPQGSTFATVGGIPAGTDLGVAPIPQQTTLIDMFYPYTSPVTSLSTDITPGVYEYGDEQAPIVLTATNTKKSDEITNPLLYEKSTNGAGFVTLHSQSVVNGTLAGPQVQPSYSDAAGTGSSGPGGNGPAGTVRYRDTITDGTTTAHSNLPTFDLVYPFYFGVGAAGLNGAAIGALTKLVAVVGNKTELFTGSSQFMYFAYPKDYADLTSILDVNNFEYLSSFTKREVSITGLDSNAVNYKVYESNNSITATDFQLTFKY